MRHVRAGVTPLVSAALGALLGGSLVAASMVAQQVATSDTAGGLGVVARPDTAVDAPIVLRAPGSVRQESLTRRFATSTATPETFGRRGTELSLVALNATGLNLATGALTTPRAGLAAALDTNSLTPTVLRNSATRTALRAERAADADDDDDDANDDDGEEVGKSQGRAKGKAHGKAKGHSSGGKKDKQEKSNGGDDDGDHEGKENGKEKDDDGNDEEEDD